MRNEDINELQKGKVRGVTHLIENYVIRLGEASGVDYKITWEYSEDIQDNTESLN